MTVIIFIIVLAVLIFVHEFGHFLFAKACGVRVDAFALGFGPKIVSWQGKETKYSVNIIPFGGYVKIFGENPDDESISGPDSKRSFVNKSKWQQVLVLVAGVLFNFIFAWILYAGVFAHGVAASTDGFEKYAKDFSNPRIMVTDILPNSPADKAGVKPGDVIESVVSVASLPNGALIKNEGLMAPQPIGQSTSQKNAQTSMQTNAQANPQTVENIQNTINSTNGAPVTFEYTRGDNDQAFSVEVTPVQGLVDGKYAIGIAMQNVVDLKLPFFTSIYEGCHYAVVMIGETAVGLYTFVANIFQGTANFSDVAGPVGIAGIVGNAASLGFTYLLMITALISINLGVINLIPFPALDGGRVLFVIIESIIRRRISPKISNTVNAIGFALLMLLMVVVTYKDIVRLVK